MRASEPFTFGIALIPRACAHDWALVEALLVLTLASVRAQTDQDFRVVIAGHDRPRTRVRDPRVEFLQVDWPVEAPGPHNGDSGRKKRALEDLILARGGGLLMLLDADDWVDRRIVESARATLGPDRIGGLIDSGLVADFQTLRAARIPDARVFAQRFHRICGSSCIGRLKPDASDPLRRNPCRILGSHHQWVEVARAHGADLVRLPVSGSYLVNTSENHSEVHGPHTGWRRRLTGSASRHGRPIDGALAARFGLTPEQIRTASARFFAQPRARQRSPEALRARSGGRRA